MFVFVLNYHGNPLMPCKPQKARKLLSEGKAKVIKQTPFTIQLLNGSSGYKQDVSLGIDAGTKHIGFSATTTKKVYFEGEFDIRTDIQELMSTRKALRSFRRSRKTRYRKARFLNRKKPVGWLPPSIRNKIDSHLKIMRISHSILPIKTSIIEVAQFNIQKIKNNTVQQKSNQSGFSNVREYVLFRDDHTCQHCKGKSKDKVLNVHHIESRKTGGNAPDNLIVLCKTCHHKIHQNNLEHIFKRKSPSLRDKAHMTTMRRFIYEEAKTTYPNVELTYGYVTKETRIKNGLSKTHAIDARCISGNPISKPDSISYLLKQSRSNNRQLHKMKFKKKGIRQANKAERFVHGYQLFDKIKFQNDICFIFGRRKTGYFDIRTLKGSSIHKSASYKKLELIERASTLLIDCQRG